MEHLLLKATVTAATDEGAFTAVISTAAVDRDKDIVEPSAVVDALHKWVPTGKKVPLSWNHSVAAEDIVGHLNPESAHVVGNEVVAEGWVDQSIEHGKHAWRLVKSGTLGFSYGYLIVKADKRKGGGLHIKALDIFEVTATPIPANGETRVLGWKAMSDRESMARRMREMADMMEMDPMPMPEAEMARRMRAMASEMAGKSTELQEVKTQLDRIEKALDDQKAAEAAQEPGTVRAVDPLKEKARTLVMDVLGEGSKPPATVTQEQPPGPDIEPDELKRRSRDLFVQLLSE